MASEEKEGVKVTKIQGFTDRRSLVHVLVEETGKEMLVNGLTGEIETVLVEESPPEQEKQKQRIASAASG